ncbi:MAG: MFS transporter [Gammaproteobacteria bacterium]|nr:MFS transporter [Gammaproteobacteria bacterium]
MRPLHYYLVGTSGWFACNGIQTVMFAWLVTIVLHESPRMVGVAQTAMLVPAMLLMLVGGSISDRYGGRRVAVASQVAATLPVLALWVVLALDGLTFGFMIAFAVAMGCAQAFLTPARDGLLNQVAGQRIQRTVALVTLVQFGIQIVAFLVAGQADRVGAGPVVLVQAAVLVIGAVALAGVAVPPIVAPRRSGSAVGELARSVADGARTVMGSRSMRGVVVQNFAVGLFFMGPYVVTIPLLVREVYDGSANDLAWLSTANAVGLIAAVFVLLLVGDVRRPGRLLLVASGVGSVALGLAGAGLEFPAFVLCIGAWGSCAGLGMSMARMIMQERAPPDQRGRVMSFFGFSFMSSAPLGTMLSGLMVEWWGAERALVVSAAAMLAALCAVGFASRLWSLDARLAREAAVG